MSVIAFTMVMPHAGKRQAAEGRARQLGAIYSRHGASVKVANVVSGRNAGCIALIRGYEDFRTASKAFEAIRTDPEHIDFWEAREANPAADIVIARDIVRRIYGKGKWETHPISLIRQYDLARNKVADAVRMLAEVEKVFSKADVNVAGLLPVTSETMSSLSVSYQFRSMEHFGEALDTVGVTDEFQALVAKAAELGTLRSASMMVPL
jgi:hypothetical protein